MVLLETFPTSFLGEVWAKLFFFFSGLTAGPTYRPLVRHSNPDTPLIGIASACGALMLTVRLVLSRKTERRSNYGIYVQLRLWR